MSSMSERNVSKEVVKDLTKLENQMAIFCLKDKRFYKLAILDHRGQRFEAWGKTITRWISFPDGILFNYTDQKVFDYLYQIYLNESGVKYPESKEDLIYWFSDYEGRISFLPSYEEQMRKREQTKIDKQKAKK